MSEERAVNSTRSKSAERSGAVLVFVGLVLVAVSNVIAGAMNAGSAQRYSLVVDGERPAILLDTATGECYGLDPSWGSSFRSASEVIENPGVWNRYIRSVDEKDR